MSLRVWLPLNGDLRNNGLSNTVITNNGTTVDNNGKIGKCYSFDGTHYIDTGFYEDFGTGDFTLCAWIYLTKVSGKTYQAIISNKTTAGKSVGCAIYWHQDQKKFLWSTADGNASTEIWSSDTFDTVVYDSWHHIAMIRNNSDSKKGYFYFDGVRKEIASVPVIRNVSNSTYTLKVGTLNPLNATYSFTGKINDVRIYDHALSAKEVKEISKGLVCHYPLISNGNENLLKYTYVNSINKNLLGTKVSSRWNSLNIEKIDGYNCYHYPSEQSSTWFYTGYWYKPLEANTTYTYSAWIYFTSSASFSFTSLGHFQVQNPNSTVTDKTHEDIPSARIYEPSIILANKWTKIRITFTTNDLADSNFQVYPRYNIAANVGELYFRDCKLEKGNQVTPWIPNISDEEYNKLGYNENIIYDTSGYNYHGINYNSIINNNSSKYSNSTFFDGSNSYIEFDNLDFMANMLPDEWSFSFWVYNQDSGDRSILFSNYGLGGVGGASFGFEKATNELLRVAYNNGTFDKVIPNSTLTVNDWTHIIVTKTKEHLISVYRNGIFIYSYINDKCNSLGKIYRLGRDSRSDSTMFKGGISDFRIYTTVLSEDDVKELYQVGASIDKDGNVFAYEFKED